MLCHLALLGAACFDDISINIALCRHFSFTCFLRVKTCRMKMAANIVFYFTDLAMRHHLLIFYRRRVNIDVSRKIAATNLVRPRNRLRAHDV